MATKIVLVGHCGADSSYLRIAVSGAAKNASVVMADDEGSLKKEIDEGAALLLVNRVLDYGFKTDEGVELIRQLHTEHPALKMMLVSNHADAHAAAVAAGGLPGFGKRQIGSPQVKEIIRAAIGDVVPE
jgi:DNA-binding NarL/FixJ family response regulator